MKFGMLSFAWGAFLLINASAIPVRQIIILNAQAVILNSQAVILNAQAVILPVPTFRGACRRADCEGFRI